MILSSHPGTQLFLLLCLVSFTLSISTEWNKPFKHVQVTDVKYKDSWLKPVCNKNGEATWQQHLCDIKKTASAKDELGPSWCVQKNPFSSVPFLFSDATFPSWMDAENGTVCETSDPNIFSFINGTLRFENEVIRYGDVRIGPTDKCKYISNINTVELDPIIVDGEVKDSPRFVVFGLVTGQIAMVHFNDDKALLIGKTTDNTTIKFLDALGSHRDIYVASISFRNSLNLFFGSDIQNGTDTNIISCGSRYIDTSLTPVDLRLISYANNTFLSVLYLNKENSTYQLKISSMNRCSVEWDEIVYDINAPRSKFVEYRPFTQVGQFNSTLTVHSSQSSRLLFEIYTEKMVKIIEFVPNRKFLSIDFETVDNSTFYVADRYEEITSSTVLGEILRRLDMNQSSCNHIYANPSQNLNLLLTSKYSNGFPLLKVMTLFEFMFYEFYEFTERDPLNPVGRDNNNCSVSNKNFWDVNTKQCEQAFSLNMTLSDAMDHREVVNSIRVRFFDIPQQFEMLAEDLTSSANAEQFCKLLANTQFENMCRSMLNGTSCNYNLYEKFGGFIMSTVLQDFWMHQIFMATSGKQILVFGLQQLMCSTYGVIVEPFTKVNIIGSSEHIEISTNSQHMFVTVSRERWELSSIKRYNEICSRLEKEPDDPFLKPFLFQCKQTPGSPVSLNQFGQYTSSCFSGMYCPSLKHVVIESVPSGKYTLRPNSIRECEENSYCISGVKQSCPIGFHCPYKGMIVPIACPLEKRPAVTPGDDEWTGPRGTTTCYGQGIEQPDVCPNGTFCITPYFPPIPINPGHYIDADSQLIKKCDEGDYCNLGRFASSTSKSNNLSTLMCPEQTYCSSPEIMEPSLCIPNQSFALYCPKGSTTRRGCDQGYYCPGPDQRHECRPGMYCPEGTFFQMPCEAGYYCPSPSERIICPARHYCKTGSFSPAPCPLLSLCPEGTKNYDGYLWGLFVDLMLVIVVFIAYKMYGWVKLCWYKRREKRRENHVKRMSEAFSVNEEVVKIESEEYSSVIVDTGRNIKLTMRDALQHFYRKLRVEIEFCNLSLYLRSGGKKVLSDINGRFGAGRLTCIIGPSGSGKSTLLSAILGNAFYAKVEGDIKINGVKSSLKNFPNIVGFVSQDDCMNRNLTVEEVITFSARSRLGFKYPYSKIETLVDDVIQMLDLNEVRNSIIGDETKRGISGGQRKRVSIAMELVSCPYALFLDEPTSSLDAFSSFEVTKSMKDIASSGITVVAVVHQPRFEIFQAFDDVILLGKGGQIVYEGPSKDALDYFSDSLHLECPPFVNPSDFFLDAIYDPESAYRAQAIRHNQDPATTVVLSIQDMFKVWKEKKMSQKKTSVEDKEAFKLLEEEERRKKQNPFLHFWLCLKRVFTLKIRDVQSFFIDNLLVYIAGLSLGLIFMNENYIGPLPTEVINSCPSTLLPICEQPLNNPLINMASLIPLAMGLCSSMSSLTTFGSKTEQSMYKREKSSGISTVAYFLAKNLEQMPNILLGPLVFLSIFFSLYSPRASALDYYGILMFSHFSAYGLGTFISITIRSDLAQLASAVSVLVFQLVGGSKPTIPQMKSLIPPLFWMSCVSYVRYTQEALYLIELRCYQSIYNIETSLSVFGYELNDLLLCVGLIPVFGVVFRILSLIMLYQINDDSFLNRVTQTISDVDGHWNKIKNFLNDIRHRFKSKSEDETLRLCENN